MVNSQIRVAVDESLACLQVIGRANFSCCSLVRKFSLATLDTDISRFCINLAECATLDSTFLGVLALLAIRGKERSISVEIVAANDNAKDQLFRMGLKRFFSFSAKADENIKWVDLGSLVERLHAPSMPMKSVILEAHEALAGINSRNAAEFEQVIEMLKNEG